VSDRRPSVLWVESRSSGPPTVLLHSESPTAALIVTTAGQADWSRLAYQFGHELGHVLCNSWGPDARPQPPCQWLEEALAEAFSLRGLSRLAESWQEYPVFPRTAYFADKIRDYRSRILARYVQLGEQFGLRDPGHFYQELRPVLEKTNGLSDQSEAFVPYVLDYIERDPHSIEDYGALNRWRQRSSVHMQDYLRLWKISCEEIGTSGRLPSWWQMLTQIN
jgi:hypothetical protein